MKKLKKTFLSLAIACMAIVIPVSSNFEKVSAAETKISVYSIDAGRKYFSENQIKDLIDSAHQTGFTHLQLILGNDGLRFLLDDMTITVNGITYNSDAVKEAITKGTKTYFDDTNGTVLTQKEMDSILAYAKTKNVEIIPAINSPGHMNAILNAMENLGMKDVKFSYDGSISKTTVDMANKEAISFTKALVEKYVKYFSGKSEYFNFGADEYANDATYHGPSKKSGYLVLQEKGLYDDFIQYVNDLASMVKQYKMTPMSFNDGLYYNKDENSGKIDTDIVVAYWTPGFDRYTPAPAKFLVDKGFKILNTNDNWYYVIGRDGNKASWWYGTDMAFKGIKDYKFTHVVGTKANDRTPIIGSMVCTWSDEPKATYKPEIVKQLMSEYAKGNTKYVYQKANYSVVKEAKAGVPENLSQYTEESVYALKKVLANTEYGLKLEEQEKVNTMALHIKQAISNLKVKTVQTSKMSVFSIDAGRKYFSKDQLKDIVKKAYLNGYTDMQLILGNDGLRFVLDDMTIHANGKVYASNDVKQAIVVGNKKYYDDPNGSYLTESEMNEVLEYAKKLNIGIIPVINSPGHMDGILWAMEELGIENPQYRYKDKVSTRTIDLNNQQAISFNQALLKKYISYFSKYSKIFNFGADEYANDIDSSKEGYYNGWSRLQGTNDYPKFVKYVNDISKMIKDANMTPMSFNDGIYYNNDDQYGEFDQDIIISYWTAGWWEFYVAKASYLYDKGHKILNTNDAWYWVLGNVDGKIDGKDVPYAFVNTVKNIEKTAFNAIPGDPVSTPSIGSVQAIWCDVPSVKHDMDRVFQLMDLYSTKHADTLVRPANYDEVEKAIASIPKDLTKYTDESVKNLNNALANVTYHLRVTDQAKVDEMAKSIYTAVANLKLKEQSKPVDGTVPTGDATNSTLLWITILGASMVFVKSYQKRYHS